MATTFIYALCEPGTRTVRYIGKTSTTPQKRFNRHIHETSKLDTHVGRWLRLLISRGDLPSLVVFREVEGDGADAEIRHIKLARGLGMRLVNATDGGEGVTMTPEIRAKIGAKNSGERNGCFGRVCPPEERALKSASMKGKHAGDKNPMFGHTYSWQEAANRSLATSGRVRPKSHRDALSRAKKGTKRSKEGIANQKATMAKKREEAFKYVNSEGLVIESLFENLTPL